MVGILLLIAFIAPQQSAFRVRFCNLCLAGLDANLSICHWQESQYSAIPLRPSLVHETCVLGSRESNGCCKWQWVARKQQWMWESIMGKWRMATGSALSLRYLPNYCHSDISLRKKISSVRFAHMTRICQFNLCLKNTRRVKVQSEQPGKQVGFISPLL